MSDDRCGGSHDEKKMRKTDFVRDLLKESIDLNKKLLGSLFHIARSSMLYLSQLEIRDKSIEDILVAVDEEHPWYGHRRIGWELGFSIKEGKKTEEIWHYCETKETKKLHQAKRSEARGYA